MHEALTGKECMQFVDHTPQDTICTALFHESSIAISDPETRDSFVHIRNSDFLKLLERDTITAANRLNGFSVSECIKYDSDGEDRKVCWVKTTDVGNRNAAYKKGWEA